MPTTTTSKSPHRCGTVLGLGEVVSRSVHCEAKAVTDAGLRWGDNTPGGFDEARERLLDAAEHCFTESGISKTTVEDIAAAANVSRATVYRYYDGRDELMMGVVLRETERFMRRARQRVDEASSLEDALLEFVMMTIKAARRDRILAVLFSVEEAQEAGRVMVEGSVLFFEEVEEFLRPVLQRFPSEVRPGLEVGDAAEWVLRVVFSFLTVRGPRRRSNDALREYLRRYLIPAVVV